MEQGLSQQEWYTTWFNSPYYHILYKHRDEQEARSFIDRLIEYLQPPTQARILDLACGQGRHSIYLSGKGYQVTGVDLSPHNIETAARDQRPGLQFFEHDIREVLPGHTFHVVLNLFTSFGYFHNPDDNERVVEAVQQELESGGVFVLDFFNTPCILHDLVEREVKKVEGIHFHLHKRLDGQTLIKTIRFEDSGQKFVFEERVRAFSFADLKEMLGRYSLKVEHTFGDYDLSPYDEALSSRLILIAKKENA